MPSAASFARRVLFVAATTTFWLLHVAAAAFGLVAFVLFKMFVAGRMHHAPQPAAA